MRDKFLFTTSEVCSTLNIGKTKLFELLANGELSSVQIGSSRLIPGDDVEDFVSRLRADRADAQRVTELLNLIDENGLIAVDRIPKRTTLADLEAAKRAVAERSSAA